MLLQLRFSPSKITENKVKLGEDWSISCGESRVLRAPLTCIKHLTVVSAGTLWYPAFQQEQKTSQSFQINPDNLWSCGRTRPRICLRSQTAWSFLTVTQHTNSLSVCHWIVHFAPLPQWFYLLHHRLFNLLSCLLRCFCCSCAVLHHAALCFASHLDF